jgi:hypothetical protein
MMQPMAIIGFYVTHGATGESGYMRIAASAARVGVQLGIDYQNMNLRLLL